MSLKHLLDREKGFVLSYTIILFLALKSGNFSAYFAEKTQSLPAVMKAGRQNDGSE